MRKIKSYFRFLFLKIESLLKRKRMFYKNEELETIKSFIKSLFSSTDVGTTLDPVTITINNRNLIEASVQLLNQTVIKIRLEFLRDRVLLKLIGVDLVNGISFTEISEIFVTSQVIFKFSRDTVIGLFRESDK